MTGLYEWNAMPHRVDVKCPACQGHAVFEFAEVLRIAKKEDVAFFQKSEQFDYQRFQDSCGHFWHGAIYYQGLHGEPVNVLHELPTGYEADNWAHSKYLMRSLGMDIGSIACGNCGQRKKHKLNWPEDAYFAAPYKGKLLWAFNRESALELLDYIGSKSRNLTRYRWRNFLLHIPSIFKSHKARNEVSKQLLRRL